MARSVEPIVANILLFNFCEQKFVQPGPITIAIDFNGLSLLIFEEKLPNYASGPKSAPNSDSFWVRRHFKVCVRVFCAPNATIFCSHTCQDQNKLHLKRWFFIFAKIGIFCNANAGSLPSVVQVYTQPYSFGGRIKLIICQIRHGLSVTIHEISTCWKKTIRWRTQYLRNITFTFYCPFC